MKYSFGLILIPLILSFSQSDQNERPEIIQDEEIVFTPPLTVSQSQELVKAAKERRLEKTMGKFLPDIYVVDISGDSIPIRKLIHTNTFISYTDLHCGWGKGYLEDIFPEIMECQFDNTEIDFIMLVAGDDIDYPWSEKADIDRKRMLQNYRDPGKIYYIDPEEAKKLNFFDSPTHLMLNAESQVVYYGSGARPLEYWLPLTDSLSGYSRSESMD